MTTLVAARKDRERLSLLWDCTHDLFFLATEILGYDLLTEEFHKPICDWMVKHQNDPFNWFCAARDHYKTTLQIADIVRHILIDPSKTHLALHAVEDEVQKLVEECGQHFQKNPRLRALRPEIMPAHNAKRFLSASSFTVRRASYDRQPTLLGKSTGQEITGVHVTGSIRPDDIIGRKTIEDSGLPKVKAWWQDTVMPVRRPGAIVMGTGTRWDTNDIYGEWVADPAWNTMVRAALETDGVPDYKGAPVLYSAEEIELRRGQMGAAFAPQMMNDPSPAGEKPWSEACEQYVSLKEAAGPGVIIVISDPAPAKTGSLDARGAKTRGDGSKDDWATAVVKLRRRGLRNEIILLDGKYSKAWDVDEGFDVICDLKRKWHASKHAVEATGQAIALYEGSHRQAARRAGVAFSPIELKGTYRGQAKNTYFAALCSKARNDEFLICSESCDAAFLEMFLGQARMWRPLANGGNSLKYDDVANVVSMATDAALTSYAPIVDPVSEWSPFREAEPEPVYAGSRHVRY